MKTTSTLKKGIRCLLLSSILLFAVTDGSAQLIMSKNFKADHTADEQKTMAMSAQGDVYVSINAKELDLLRADGQYDVVTNTLSGARAGILAKLDASGNLLWSNVVAAPDATTKNTQITGIAENGDGYVYVVGGITSQSATGGTGSVFGINCTIKGYMDFYVAKLNAVTGQAVWAKTFGTTLDWELPTAIAVDNNGNVFISGIFTSRNNSSSYPLFGITYKDQTSENFSVTGNWGEDILTIKLDAAGDAIWAKSLGGMFRENGSPCLAVDDAGNVIVGGVLNAAAGNLTAETEAKRTFVVGDKSYILNASTSKQSILVKYAAANGSVLWSRFFTGAGHQEVMKVTVAPGTQQVIVTGKANNEFRIEGSSEALTTQTVGQPAGDHAMLVAFDNDGKYVWSAIPAGDVSSEYKSITAGSSGDVYVSGYFNTALQLDGISLSKTGTNTKEGFFAKYNAQGKCLYAETVKGDGAESLNTVSVGGGRLALAGDRTTDVLLPFTDAVAGLSPISGNKWYYALYNETPSISGTSVLEGKRFVTFTYQLVPAFFNLPYTFTYSIVEGSLPAGWALNATTGVISGSAATVGSGSFKVRVLNTSDNVSVEKVFTYTILAKPCDVLSVSPVSLDAAVTGPIQRQFVLEKSDGKVVWSSENLPQGLTLNDSTGVLSGVLRQTGTVTFTINAKEESGCEASRNYSFNCDEFNFTAVPYLSWISQVQGSGFDHGKTNTIDKDGNVVIASSYRSAIFSDAVSFADYGNADALIAKYNGTNGAFSWARGIGGSTNSGRNEQGQSVFADPSTGDLIFTGIVTPGARIGDVTSLDSINTKGGRDLIVARFGSDGARKWYKLFGSAADWEAGTNTITDNKGNIYVTGYLNTGSVEIPMVGGEIETLTGTSFDLLVLKLNSNGECIWAKRIGGPNKDGDIFGLSTDNDCNLYISGMINGGSAVFGAGKTIDATGLTSFVCKFNEAGSCQWVTPLGANGNIQCSYGRPLAIDATGNLYFTTICKGTFAVGTATVSVANDKTDGVLFKLNNNGEFVTYKQFASVGDDGVTSVTTDNSNNVYVVGYFGAELPLYGSIRLQLNPGSSRGAFVAKYSSAGDYLYGYALGCSIGGTYLSNIGINIEPATGDIILSGPFADSMYPSGASGEPKVLYGGGLFVGRYKQTTGLYGVLPEGNRGVAYKATLGATGFQKPLDIRYSLESGSLPAGLALNAVTGEITGIPSAFGKSTFTINATDNIVSASKEMSVNIIGVECNLAISSIVFDDAVNGTYYEKQLRATGANGNVTWSAENPAQLPIGLSIKTVDNVGYLYGTPNSPASEYAIKFVAVDEAMCKATRTAYLNLTGPHTALETPAAPKALSVYPNPVTNGVMKLSIDGLSTGDCQLDIVDMLGSKVYSEVLVVDGKIQKEIAVNTWTPGIYFVFIKTESHKEALKFIIK